MDILESRLLPPGSNSSYLVRSRLISKLNHNNFNYITVTGGAGMGKSTVVSQWLVANKHQVIWITLDNDLNNLRLLWSHLLYAVQKIKQDTFFKDLEFRFLESPKSKYLVTEFLQSIKSLKNSPVLVLDDLHFIKNPETLDFVSLLMKSYSKEQNKVVVISRSYPKIQIIKEVAYNQVIEINSADLLFTQDETIDLFKKELGENYNLSIAKTLHAKTDGWIIPMKLILGELKTLKRTDLLQLGTEKSKFKVFDLLNRVLSDLDEGTQKCLLLASLLPQFNVEILRSFGPSMFTEYHEGLKYCHLEKDLSFFFILPVDPKGNWYRFHHIVQEFLQELAYQKLEKKQLKKAFANASKYFEKNNLTLAIQMSLNAGDHPNAIKLFELNKCRLLQEQKFEQVRHLLEVFPDDILNTEPSFLLIRVLLGTMTRDIEKSHKHLKKAKALIEAGELSETFRQQLLGEYYSIYSGFAYQKQDYETAIKTGEKAINLLKENCVYLTSNALWQVVVSLQLISKPKLAKKKLQEALQEREVDDNHLMNSKCLASWLCYMQGCYAESMADAQEAYVLGVKKNNPGIILASSYFISLNSYFQNDLDTSLIYADIALRNSQNSRPNWIIETYYLKSLIYSAFNNQIGLENTLKQFSVFSEKFRSRKNKTLINQMNAELSLMQGETLKAGKNWSFVYEKQRSFHYHYYNSDITEIKLLIYYFKDLNKAQTKIEECENSSAFAGSFNLRFQLQCIKAILFFKLGSKTESIILVEDLITKARPMHLIRVFTDFGDDMHYLLRTAHKRLNHAFIKEVLVSFERKSSKQHEIDQFTKLTSKEIKILESLSLGLRNKEIAEKLHHSEGTIKTYIYNIYQKIGARNRGHAVQIFESLHI